MISYGFTKALDQTFEKAVAAVTHALQTEGFGVLTKIDMQEKLKEKLGVEYKKYLILGACNPPLAYKALQAEVDIGLLLPCNIIIYEEDSSAVVSIIRPSVAMSMVNNLGLRTVATEVEAKLKRVFDSLA